MIIFGDNLSSISMAKNHGSRHGRAKHIDIKHHFLRDCVERNEIKFKYCPTRHMIADILSKNVKSSTIFEPLRQKIMGHDNPFDFVRNTGIRRTDSGEGGSVEKERALISKKVTPEKDLTNNDGFIITRDEDKTRHDDCACCSKI